MAVIFSPELLAILAPVIVFVFVLLTGLVLRKFLFSRLERWAEHTKTDIDDIIIESTKGPFLIWCLMAGLYFSMEVSRLPEDIVDSLGKILSALAIISVTLVLANTAAKLISAYSRKFDAALPVNSLTKNVTKIVIFVVGGLIVLNSLGISITPILATLGVGGLAVALALQETLSNLFAGFYTSVSKQVRVGDFIKLETGEEGYVTDIGWRSTRVKMLSNNVVLIPNSKLAQAVITNYYLPDKELAVLVQVGVHYDSDLKKVEKVTCEVAKQVMKEVAGGVPEFVPFIRYHTFGDFSINFTVILRAKEFVDNYLIKHEFIKRLHERYKKEDIVIPYPIRAINYDQEKAYGAGTKK